MQAKLTLALALVLALATVPFAGAAREEPAPPITVLFVRHAETAADTRSTRDPELSDAGRTRAAALAHLVSSAGITHAFASEFRRTQQTIAGVVDAAGLELAIVPAGDATALLERLRALPAGAVALVAGHSNTVPALVQALGGTVEGLHDDPDYGPRLGHDEYGRLFVVTLPAGEATEPHALELRYGE